MSELWDDGDVPDSELDEDEWKQDESPEVSKATKKRNIHQLYLIQPSQEEEDELPAEDEDEVEIVLLSASKRGRPDASVEDPEPSSRVPAVKPAPALPQLTNQALISQHALAANLARFKSAQAQLEYAALQEEAQDLSQDPEITAVTTTALPKATAAAAAGRGSRAGDRCSNKPQGGVVDLLASDDDDDDPALVEDINWQQVARQVGADTDAAAGSRGQDAAAVAGGGDCVKVQLVFKMKAGQSVKVKVVPSDPLQHAFDRFIEHAKGQGWVSSQAAGQVRFIIDGDKLTGKETAEDLDLEDDMMVEVHF